MISAHLLIEARRRAGLSQRALAARAGVSQQEIARYERGRVVPSLERLRTLIAACGLELTYGLARADDSYDQQIAAALALDPKRRLTRALADAQALRSMRGERSTASAARAPEVLQVLRALEHAGVEYVLVGELAETIHGSPLLPLASAIEIVPRAGQREQLSAAVCAAGGTPAAEMGPTTIDASCPFSFERFGLELVIEPAPAGTRGYEDLRRDATRVQLDGELVVNVASMLDLVRIAAACTDAAARLPALRRTLELATPPFLASAA